MAAVEKSRRGAMCDPPVGEAYLSRVYYFAAAICLSFAISSSVRMIMTPIAFTR
jgi:hypothetical protein